MNMLNVVKARKNIGAIMSGYNVPEGMYPLLEAAHDALLYYERQHPKEQAVAFAAIEGAGKEWEIA